MLYFRLVQAASNAVIGNYAGTNALKERGRAALT